MPALIGALIALTAVGIPIDVTGSVSVGGKPLADAVVWLDAPDAPPAPEPMQAELDQRNLAFYPHVLAVRVGTTVKFPNDDRVFHNVFSYHEGKKFELGLYPVGAVKYVPFDRPGLSRVFCNIHPQMAAYVMVLDTPYFAVSDLNGRFALRGVPAAEYTYHAWRPGAPILTDTTTIAPAGTLVIAWP